VPPEGVKRQRTRTDGGEVDGGRRNQSANTHQARGNGGGCAHPWTCPGRLLLIRLELGRLAEDRRLCKPWYFGKAPVHIPNDVDITVTPKGGKMVQDEDCFPISDAEPLIKQVRQMRRK
jgi:hypothetical protein